MMNLYALAVVALLGAVEPSPVSFTTIAEGGLSRIEEARTVVVRTEGEWASLWKAHAGPGKPPVLDLSRSMVIAVFLGTRTTAGYTVKITSIEAQPEGLVVTYRETVPPQDAMVAEVLTAPFHIVRTPSRPGAVTFRRVN